MLKGKAKIDFERWCVENVTMNDTIRTIIDYDNLLYYPETMQQGVLLEYFRKRGISITIRFGLTAGYYCEISEDDESDDIVLSDFENYNTAFTTAIQKACELYGRGE